MTVSITHALVSTVPDDGDPGIVSPNDWNADHTVPIASTAQAQAGTNATTLMTPALTAAAISSQVLPASLPTTDNAVTRFDGTAGRVQNSGVTVDDSNNVSVPSGSYVSNAVGGANPLVLPTQWGGNSITTSFAVGGLYTANAAPTATGIQQISAWLDQSGTEHAYAVFGQARATGGSSQVWGFQSVAYAHVSGAIANGMEIDIGTDVAGGTAYGLALNAAGTTGSNTVIGIQLSSLATGGKFSDGVVFVEYGSIGIFKNSLITNSGAVSPTHLIDFSTATPATDSLKLPGGFTVDKNGYLTAPSLKVNSTGTASAGSITADSFVGMKFTANVSPSAYAFAFEKSDGTNYGGYDTSGNFLPNAANTYTLGSAANYWSSIFGGTATLGKASAVSAILNLAGTTSGTVSVKIQDAAGTYNFNLPTTAGTSGDFLTSGGGSAAAMTWTTPGTAATKNTGTSGATIPLLNGNNSWSADQTFTTASAFGTVAEFVSTEASATFGPVVKIRHTRTGPAASDGLGWLGFNGNNSSNADTQYGVLSAVISSPTAGAENGLFRFAVAVAGTTTTEMELGTGVTIGAPAAGHIGVGNLAIQGVIATRAPQTKTADYSLAATDSSLIFNGSGTISLTLQAASSYTGRWLYVKTIAAQLVNSASSNVVPIGSATAGTAILAATAGKWAILQSDGTNWITMAAN